MDAPELLNRFAEAIGGMQRLQQVQSIYSRAKLEFSGTSGAIEDWQKPDGQHAVMIDLSPLFKQRRVFDGHKGWIVGPKGRVREMQPDELEDEILSSYLGSYSFFFQNRLPGTVAIGGEDRAAPYYVLQLNPQGGRRALYYLDKKTFLPIKQEVTRDGKTTTTSFDDWRTVEGIKLPFVYRQTNGNPQEDATSRLEEVRFNTPLDAKLFAQPVEVKEYSFAKGNAALRIPFTLSGNIIFLQAKVNNSTPRWFFLDSGFGGTVLDTDFARSLGLKAEGKVDIQGTGGTSEGGFIKGVSVDLPGVQLRNRTCIVSPLAPLKSRTGKELGGILGSDFMDRFVVEIDYQQQVLNLYEPEAYEYKGSAKPIPIAISGNTPVAHATINVAGRGPVEGDFLIDTGSDGALNLYRPFVESQKLLGPNQKTVQTISFGVAKESKNLVTRLEGLQLGEFNLKDVTASTFLDEEGAGASTDIAGGIGTEVLRRFKVIFDLPEQVMVLEPNGRFNESFEEDMSGLVLDAAGPKSRALKVVYVINDSPAARAGLRTGDWLTAIDGKPVSAYTLEQVYRLFKRAGQEYTLSVKRDRRASKARIKLRRLV